MPTQNVTDALVVTPDERDQILEFISHRVDARYEHTRALLDDDARGQQMRDEVRAFIDIADQVYAGGEPIVIRDGLRALAELLEYARRESIEYIQDDTRAIRKARAGDTDWMIDDGDLDATEAQYREVCDRELDEIATIDRLLVRLGSR